MSVLDSALKLVTGGDSEHDRRMERRRSVREEIAKCQVRGRRIAELDKELAEIDGRKDRAADAHAAECAPLQQELEAIERRILAALTDRTAASPEDEARRLELLKQLSAANDKLAAEVAAANEARKLPARERERLRIENASSGALEIQLFNQDCGNPVWLGQHFAALQGIKWTIARREAAAGHVKQNTSLIATAKRRRDWEAAETYEKRLRKWEVELELAGEAVAAAQAEELAIRQKMINE